MTAREQTAGRGRQGRTWTSPPGVLPLSLVLRDVASELLPLTVAVAVADVCGDTATIKWPNDIWLGDGKKVAGILVEARPPANWCVAGIGINATARARWPRGPRARRVGDNRCCRAWWKRSTVRCSSTPTRSSTRGAHATPCPAARSASAAPTRAGNSVGVACGVDGRGRLLVDRGGGAIDALLAGEVHLTGVS